MIFRWFNIQSSVYTLIVCIPLVLIGCTNSGNDPNQVSHNGKDLTISLSVPGFLATELINNHSLQAKAILDEGTPAVLTVNPDNTITGEMLGIRPGTYQLKVVYFVEVASIQTPLAIYETSVTVIKDKITAVIINDTELNRNIDNDGDGYTNLAEVRIGTNPHDSSEKPAGESPLFSLASGSVGEVSSSSFSSKISIGESINGVAASTNFVIVSGSGELE